MNADTARQSGGTNLAMWTVWIILLGLTLAEIVLAYRGNGDGYGGCGAALTAEGTVDGEADQTQDEGN